MSSDERKHRHCQPERTCCQPLPGMVHPSTTVNSPIHTTTFSRPSFWIACASTRPLKFTAACQWSPQEDLICLVIILMQRLVLKSGWLNVLQVTVSAVGKPLNHSYKLITNCIQRCLTVMTCQSITVFRGTLTIRTLVMGDGALCYGALEIVGLLLLCIKLISIQTTDFNLVITNKKLWINRSILLFKKTS